DRNVTGVQTCALPIFGEGPAGGGHGAVDIGLLTGGGLEVVLVRDRVQDVECGAVGRVDELAVDVVLDVFGKVLRGVVTSWCRCGHGVLQICQKSERSGSSSGCSRAR